MIASAHIAAGIVIGVSSARFIRRPAASIAAAFVSAFVAHLLMDALPHSDYHSLSRTAVLLTAACEVVVVGVIAACLLYGRMPPRARGCVAAGVFGSVLPDAKFIAPLFLPTHYARLVEHIGNRLHGPFHSAASLPLLGLATELLCTILLLLSLRSLAAPR